MAPGIPKPQLEALKSGDRFQLEVNHKAGDITICDIVDTVSGRVVTTMEKKSAEDTAHRMNGRKLVKKEGIYEWR